MSGLITNLTKRLASTTGASLAGFTQAVAGAVAGTVERKLRETVSLKDLGAAGTGLTDDSAAITAGGALAAVAATAGSYKMAAPVTPDPARFDVRYGAEFYGMRNGTTKISARDGAGRFIGWQHNYNESTNVAAPIVTGKLLPPPVSAAAPNASADVLAHWYNDFGLECVRAANGAIGSTVWYTWEWAHTNNASGYEPRRHPALGWYRGDDATVLDWQCYWLREHGVKGVILQADALDTTTWANATDVNRGYWLYQLFKNVPNFQGLSYILGGPSSGDKATLKARWTSILNDVCDKHPNFYVVEVHGRRYPAIYLHDMGTLRAGTFGGADTDLEAWLKTIADFFKVRGWDGVCVFSRYGGYYTDAANYTRYADRLSVNGVVLIETDYGDFSGTYTNPATYSDYVDNFDQAYEAVKFRRVPNVMTARESKAPHPSGWTTTGSTPALFAKAMQKAVNAVSRNRTVPNIVTVYNVSEWAEGGPALQPNMQDGFGYLQAIRKADNQGSRAKGLTTEKYYRWRIDGATRNIAPTHEEVRMYTTFDVTISSGVYLPTIAPGVNGQKIRLINTADAGNFNIVLEAEAIKPGTKLYMESNTVTLGSWDAIEFTYSDLKSGWVQSAKTVSL